MNFIRKMAMENKKVTFYLIALIAVGVFALVLRRNITDDETAVTSLPQEITTPTNHAALPRPPEFSTEQALETRLEEFFSLVEGAGKVRVMISPLTGGETVFAVDKNQNQTTTSETDSGGGTREVNQHQSQETTVIITDRGGTSYPLVLREVEPTAQGIVIIAQGGNDPFVRDALTRAAMAVLGLDAHTVQVLQGNF